MGSGGVLIGRDQVLARARQVLDAGAVGVLVAGPAGTGVSRLLDELVAAGSAAPAGHGPAPRIGRVVGSDPCRRPLADLEALLGPVYDLAAARRALEEVVDVLVVDDAELLDAGTAELLWHVAGAGRQLVIGTHDAARCHPLVRGLWRQGQLERIDLDPLDQLSCGQLLEQILGGPVDARSTRLLHWASSGLPLLLGELGRAARDSGQLAPTAGIWRLDGDPPAPERIQDLVGRVAPPLAAGAGHDAALDLLAVTEPLPVAVAEALLGANVVEDLLADRLAAVQDVGWDLVLELHHPVVGLARRAAMDRLRRSVLCGRAIDAADRVGHQLDELTRARWSVDAARRPEPSVLVAAIWTALARLELELARRLAELALDEPEARYLLGRVLERQGQVEVAARAHRSLAADANAPIGLRVLASVNLADILLWSLGDASQAVAVAEGMVEEVRAASGAGAEDPVELQVFLAGQQLFVGRTAAALDRLAGLGENAIAAVQSEVLVLRGVGLAMAGHASAARKVAEEGLALADSATARDDGVQVELHHLELLLALLHGGALVEATEVAERAVEVAVGGAETSSGWVTLGASLVMQSRGLLDRARALAERATAVFEVMDNRTGRRWGTSAELMAAAGAGRADDTERLMKRLDEIGAPAVVFMEPAVVRAVAWGEAILGRHRSALDTLRRAARLAEQTGQHALEAEALHDLVRLGQAGLALPRLVELAESLDGSLPRLRLEHATALDRADPQALLVVAEQLAEVGSALWAAEAAAQAAELLHHQGSAARSRAAAAMMAGWRAQTEGAATPPLVGATTLGLTAREREVALRAAAGAPSRAVADELGISPRTVDNLLHRAYAKLGISGRTELGEMLGQPG